MGQRFLSDIHATAGLKDSSGDLGTNGQVLSSTGSGSNWVSPTVGTTVIHKDAFTATSNQTAFTLANSVDSEDKTQVYIDGAYQSKGGYTVSGTTLTFDTGLETSSAVEVITFATATANNAATAVKLDTFTGDGSDLTFVLNEAVVDEKVTQVYINGVYQNKSTYSIDADLVTLTFGSGNAPPNNSTIEVISFKTITSTDGTFTATTFLGDLNGTINTATTATTQSAGNNSTKVATTAYADAKVADAINNGTTAIAPSQNVVFDALALKANLAGPTFTGTLAGATATFTSNITGSRLFSGDGGNKTNPMIANGSDQDTGIFFPAANTMAFSAGDTESFRIAGANATFTGNVGIGTTSPNNKLDVNGGIVCSPNTDGKDTFELSTNALDEGRLRIKNVDTTTVQIRAGGDTYFNGGNVGIGNTSPDQKLHISGTIHQTDGTADTYFGLGSDNDNYISTNGGFTRFRNGGTTQLNIAADGVATFSANHIQGSDTLRLLAPSTILYLDANTDIAFRTSSTSEKMRLSQGGNFGIGDSAFNYYANRLVVKAPDEDGVTFLSATGHKFWLCFADGTTNHSEELAGHIAFDHGDNTMKLGGAAGYDWITLGGSGDITFANTNGTRLVSYSDNQFYLSNQTAWDSNVQGGNENRLIFEGRYRSSANDTTALGEIRVTRDSTGDGYYGGTMQFYTRVNGGSITKSLSIFSDQRVAAEGSVHAGHDGSTGSSGAGTATVGATIGGDGFITGHRTNATCLYIGTTTSREVMAIFRNTDQAGKIRITGTSTVAFESGSDYRLKEDLKDFNGLDIISKLKVYNFNWIGEDRRDHGLVAHEVQEVLPDLVSGKKDGVLENGKIDKQALDYGRFTPMLIKAMQEQQAVIEDLKSRIETLEG